jgi:hypothetical protein
MISLMMEAASNSEASVNFYQTTRRNDPVGSHLRLDGELKPHGSIGYTELCK